MCHLIFLPLEFKKLYMAKLTFKIRDAKDKASSIQLVFSYGKDRRLRYSTGFRVQNRKNWDSTKMQIKNVIEELDRTYVNNKLNELKTTVVKRYSKRVIEEGKTIDNDFLKDICDEALGRKKLEEQIKKLDLLSFYVWFIKFYKINPLMTTSKPLAKGTAKTYNNAYTILKRFNDEKEYRLTYDKINQRFYRDFMNWLFENNYSTNYIGTQIKILKTMLNASLDLGHHTNIEHRRRYFKKPFEEVNNIYLNQEELQQIFALDFSSITPIIVNKTILLSGVKLDRARDLFLISANTGLRVSDFNRLDEKNIIEVDGRKYFKVVTKKSEKPVTIPINSMVNTILNKRNGLPPDDMPEQHLNYALKEIGKLAEINSEEVIVKTIGGVKTEAKYKKYNLISNHTARRSYCSNAYLAGVPVIDIMTTSGQSTEKVFYNYIKASGLQRAQKIGAHPFYD